MKRKVPLSAPRTKATTSAQNSRPSSVRLIGWHWLLRALWEIIREHSDFKEEDLEKKMLEIDLRDGKTDGKIGALVLNCPACGSKTNSKRPTCIICGALVVSPHKFAG